jgi:hypothetical protein
MLIPLMLNILDCGEGVATMSTPLFRYRHGTHACVCVTDLTRYILSRMGIFVLNYIDDIIGFAPDSIAESHFQLTVGTLFKLGFKLSNS